MITVVLIIHLLIAVALVTVVLMQRSEGGALGMGGGGGGGFLTGRGTANLLTRTTAALAVGFFVTSITLSLLAGRTQSGGSIFDAPAAPAAGETNPATPAAPKTGGGVLDDLQSGRGFAPLPKPPAQ